MQKTHRNTKHIFFASDIYLQSNSPPREEGWLRHQENFGAALLSAAAGVVVHKSRFGVSDHPGRCRVHPSSRGGEYTFPRLFDSGAAPYCLPGRCSRSRLFSLQMNSMSSVSGNKRTSSVTVQGLVYAFASSIVI
jgi:hypothetical protein